MTERGTARHPRVVSITVVFDPDPERLFAQVSALRGQVDEILVVDNGPNAGVERDLRERLARLPEAGAPLRFIPMEGNHGVARGYNVGAREAAKNGARFVLLLDDDSIPADDMVERLVAGYEDAHNAAAEPVAAVGPRVRDPRNPADYPFIRLGWLHNPHVHCAEGDRGLVACDFLISSGSLIALDALEAVGEFDESLFIDSVDLEWCTRARARRFGLHGVCDARLDHQLGERRVFLNCIRLVVHPPTRLYYMTRNRFLLYRRPYMPLKWKLKDFLRALAKFVTTMVFLAPRGEYARMTMLALRDALAGRGGKFGHDET